MLLAVVVNEDVVVAVPATAEKREEVHVAAK